MAPVSGNKTTGQLTALAVVLTTVCACCARPSSVAHGTVADYGFTGSVDSEFARDVTAANSANALARAVYLEELERAHTSLSSPAREDHLLALFMPAWLHHSHGHPTGSDMQIQRRVFDATGVRNELVPFGENLFDGSDQELHAVGLLRTLLSLCPNDDQSGLVGVHG